MTRAAAPRSVFIVGYPRSGTTLVHHTLMSSGEFPPLSLETHYFSHHHGRYGSLADAGNRGRFESAIAETDWWAQIGLTRADLSDAVTRAQGSYGGVFREIMARFAENHGKRAWIEKTPWHIARLGSIVAEFPHASIILVMRDPRDVALSLVNWKWARSVNRALIGWAWHMRRFDADAKRLGIRYLTVRYEDFVNDVPGELARIGGFLDMTLRAPDASEAGFGVLGGGNSSFGELSGGVSKKALGRWRKSMSEAQLQEAAAILGEWLDRYGYERAAAGGPPLPRRLLLGGMDWGYAGLQEVRRWRRGSA